MANSIIVTLQTRINAYLNGWPNWSWEKSTQENPELFLNISENFSDIEDTLVWNSEEFENYFSSQIKRQRLIKVSWGLVGVLIFFTGTSACLFISNHRLWFILVILSALGLVGSLSIIRHLNTNRNTHDPKSFISNELDVETKKLMVKKLEILESKRFQLFFQDNHGNIFELTSKIWTAQNWFFLLSPNPKHTAGISLNRIPPAHPLLLLKNDFDCPSSYKMRQL